MKVKSIVLFVAAFCLLLLFLQVFGKSTSQESQKESPIAGVWEYMLDTHEGMAIYSDNYFVHFAVPKRDSSKNSSLTDTERIDIFKRMIALAGTYTFSDTIVTCTITYHKNPSQIGNSFKYSFTLDGDVATYRIRNDEGRVIETGESRKIE